jgi:hypothetical protein
MKVLRIFTLLVLIATMASFTVTDLSSIKQEETIESMDLQIKLINDTNNKIALYIGERYVSLKKRGGSAATPCKVGTKIYRATSGEKKKFLFKITESMCGKRIKLSKYL